MRFVAENYTPESDKDLFQSDFHVFYQRLVSLLSEKNALGNLHERDIAARQWYRNLFADSANTENQRIVRSPETDMIESSFNCAGLFNKHYRAGADYYSGLNVDKGAYYNLIVYENTDNGFSLYDMDEIDFAVFELLNEPLSVNELLFKMRPCFEDDVVENHFEAVENLILMSIKQLVVKKALQPCE